jgi:hypothetical protein
MWWMSRQILRREQMCCTSAGMSHHDGKWRTIERDETKVKVEHSELVGDELEGAQAKLGVQTMFTHSAAHETAARSLLTMGRRRR